MKKGLVIKSTGSWFTVLDGIDRVQCRIQGKFRLKGLTTTNPVTVGDKVDFELLDDKTGIIRRIEPRSNYIIRRATRFHKEAHLLAANIDLAFLMVSLKHPTTRFEFIDRFLITAEAYHIKSILVINKIDLLEKDSNSSLEEFINTYTLAGYDCISLSVKNNFNIEKVRARMTGKVNLIAGNSGVGKSSLINALTPGLKLKTDEISEYHKSGKHTTTFSELFCLEDKTYVIDTPGIKGFGLIDLGKAEVGLFFPEIFRTSKNCKFSNCSHVHEPDCAVIHAVEIGQIGSTRYKSYLNIIAEDGSKYR